MKDELDKIELRSDELDSILGKTPNSLIRWGISVVFGFLAVILIGSCFFKYPEVVEAPVEITTANPPTSIVARASGKITHLFVKDKEIVTKNTVLATIDNPADYEQIKLLQNLLSKIKPSIQGRSNGEAFGVNMYPLDKLGEVQPAFTSFTKALSDVIRYYQLNIYPQKIAAINKQIGLTKLYNSRLQSQSRLVEQDLHLGKIQHNRDSVLYRNKIIAQSELDVSSSTQIQKRYSFEGAQLSMADSKLKLATLEQQALELRLQSEQEEKQLYLTLEESHKTLLNQLTTWEQNYVLKAPIDGKVTYTKFWSENQNVTAGEIVLTVVPQKASDVIGRLNLPMAGAGRVRIGNTVNVRLNNYPYMEFGTVKAEVANISMTTANEVYPVELRFPKGLNTNYNTKLRYSNGMTGIAEIITEDMTLFERFFNPVRALFKKHLDSESAPDNEVKDTPTDTVSPPAATHKVVIKRFYEKK